MMEKMLETMLPTIMKTLASSPAALARADDGIAKIKELVALFVEIRKNQELTLARLDGLEALIKNAPPKSDAEIIPIIRVHKEKES